MNFITSSDNPAYKNLKRLLEHVPVQKKQKRTLLEGVHLCGSYFEQIGIPELCVVGESAMLKEEVLELVKQCQNRGTSCLLLSDSLARNLSATEQGIHVFFLIHIPSPELDQSVTKTVVLLDRVQDPGNVGSILRSAAAAGIEQILCSAGTASCWSPKVLRSGMGAHFALKIIESVDLLQWLPTSAAPILATSSYAKKSLYEINLNRPVVWLFGHEGQGVSPDLLMRATDQVRIPHIGKVESLNVAASSAICFFEQVRQKLAS